MFKRFASSICALLLLSACSVTVNTQPTDQEDTAAVEETEETHTGVIQRAGVSIYQEGTHKIILDDGSFLLLESDEVDLGGYIGEKAEIRGFVRETVEAGGRIMRVTEIELTDGSDDTSEDEDVDSTDDVDANEEETVPDEADAEDDVDIGDTSDAADATVEDEPEVVQDDTVATDTVDTGSDDTSSGTESDAGAEGVAISLELNETAKAEVEKMASKSISAETMGQTYTNTYFNFSVPVHNHFFYNGSFANVGDIILVVAMSTAEIEELADAPVQVRLVRGDLEENADGSIQTSGAYVVGKRAFRDGLHFEVVAPKELQSLVEYLLQEIRVVADDVAS